MSSSTIVKRKTEYDPTRQWGLQPSTSSGATYIVSGHVVRGDSKSSLFVAENMGREGQAKAKRKVANDEVEKQLKKMLERDREGMEAVLRAREASQSKAASSGGKTDAKGKGIAGPAEGGKASTSKKAKSVEESAVAELNKPKKAYCASIVRSLGFDPTLRPGHRRVEATDDAESKVSFRMSASHTN